MIMFNLGCYFVCCKYVDNLIIITFIIIMIMTKE